MANVQQITRDYLLRARSEGVAQVTADAQRLGAATDSLAVKTETQSKSSISAAAALERHQRSLDLNYRATQQFERAQRDLNIAQAQGLIGASRYAELSNLNTARLNEQTKAANDNAKAANDNAEGWKLSGVEMASVTNHMKQAAAAAYVLSPAFRALVNPAIAVGVRATGTALAAMGPSAATVAAEVGSRLVPALSLVLRVAGPIMLVVDAIKLVAFAWRSAGEQIEAYNTLAKNAVAASVTTDFLQRITKGADQAAEAMKKLATVTADKLGGSELQVRLKELTKVGNFEGNTGVAQLARATNTEEKFRAIVSLVDQAMQKGERLAALDLTAKFLPADMQDKLARNSGYLKEMLDSADKIAATKLVKQADIDAAVALQKRYDDAVKILSERWIPFQDTITAGGMVLQRTWVAIVESIASAVNWMAKLVEKLAVVPSAVWAVLSKGGFGAGAGGALGPVGAIVSGASGLMGRMDGGAPAANYSDARQRLAGMLQNTANVAAARDQTNATSALFRKDTSFDPDKKKEIEEVNDAVDRAINTLRRHIEAQKADALAIGLGDAALARFRAEAQQTAAIEANGGKITAEQTAAFEKLKIQAYDAAAAMADLKIKAQIDWQKKTMLLSQEDVQIAAQLQHKYGTDVPRALASTEASIIRVQNAQSMVVTGFRDIGESVVAAGLKGGNVMAALMSGLDNLAAKMAKGGFNNAVDGLLSGNLAQAGLGAAQLAGSAIISAFTGDQKKQEELRKARAEWEKAGPAFSAFLKQMSGGVQGNLSQQIEQASQREADFEDKAWKARDTAAINAARAGLQKFSDTQKLLFQATFDATVQGLNDSLGLDSPFMKAVNNVKTALTAQLAFIDDTDIAIGENIPGTMAKARAASESYLLSLLQQAPALSAVQTGMMQIHGTAAALQGALVQLGMSSQDAAASINEGVSKAIAGLKTQFEAGLSERLNTASGQSFLNDATKLIQQHQQDLLDAAALGTDPALVAQVFQAEAQKIVDSAELTGEAFAKLQAQFPSLQGVVHEFTASAVADAQKLRDAQNAAARSVTDYLANLTAGPGSTSSPTATLASAQTLYQSNLALAQAGNADAQSKWASLADNLEKAARLNFASGQGYQDIKSMIISQGLGLPAVQATTDPVTQAVRDAITAIQIGNAALAAANSNTTTALIPAVNAGNAANVALALKTYFDQIDPTGKLTSVVTNTLAGANNTQLTAGRLIETNQNTIAAANATSTNNELTTSNNNLTGTGNTTLDAIRGLQATATSQLGLLNAAINPAANPVILTYTDTGAFTSGPHEDHNTVNVQLLTVLHKIAINTWATAGNTGRMLVNQGGDRSSFARDGTLAAGGLITGPGTGTSDSIPAWLSNREFVIKNAAVEKFGVGFFEQLNAGIMPSVINDNRPVNVAAPVFRGGGNADVVAELRANREELRAVKAELANLQTIVAGSGANTARAVVEGTDKVAKKVDEQTGALASQERQSNRQRKVANG